MSNKGFLSNLEEVSGGRDLVPWLGSLGFAHSAVTRIRGGQPPSGELLRALVRAERVSMRWLEEGRGAPYLVTRVTSDEEAIEYLEELYDEEDWSVILATADDHTFAVILYDDLTYKIKEQHIEYRAVEVVSGNITLETVRWMVRQHHAIGMLRLTPVDMQRLSRGYMGNVELFGFSHARKSLKGLKERSQPLADLVKVMTHDSPYQALFEPPEGKEHSKEPLTTEEAILVEKYRQLTPDDQRHTQAVVGAFAHKDSHGKRKVK